MRKGAPRVQKKSALAEYNTFGSLPAFDEGSTSPVTSLSVANMPYMWLLSVIAFALALVLPSEATFDNSTTRAGKALSVFQVVRFPNAACTGSSSLNGTCYTSSECTNKGGTSAGSCASGFGVCCTFTLGCGSRIAENCTYFQSSSTSQPAGTCSVTICKCSSDICQLRLDMNTFVISGPSTNTFTLGWILAGTVNNAAGIPYNAVTQCQTDTFSVTGVPGGNPPAICGTNTGYHMYADASDSCNTLDFQLGQTGVGTTIPTRQWNIKITQISCYDANKAPPGCVQYFYGATSGTILNSFNYANSVELANQKQTICIRREKNYCKICFSNTAANDFQVSSMAAAGTGYTKGSLCCGYGTDGKKTSGYDCLIIPGAMKAAAPSTLIPNQAFCGVNLVTANGVMTAATICTKQTPFNLDFITDSYSFASAKVKGFKLVYWETTC